MRHKGATRPIQSSFQPAAPCRGTDCDEVREFDSPRAQLAL